MLDLILKQAGVTEPGFTRKTIKWAINCTEDCRYTGLMPLGERAGQSFPCCPNLSSSELISGGVSRAHFLSESLTTLALYWDEKLTDKD
ncbi:MAG: hypothetical protein ACR2HF_07500, partial [Methylococcaceae bacterium]